MASLRTIQSPGVEIREIDLSTRAVTPVGTNVLVTGFAPQGPTYEIVELASLNDFETVYGTPTNAAERYFYYSVRQLFTAGSNPTIKASRLPYGSGTGEGTASNYSALAFPVVAIPTDTATYPASAAGTAGTVPLSSAQGYYFGEPALVALTEDQYNSITQNGLDWATTTGNVGTSAFLLSGAGVVQSLSAAGMIVLNKAKTTINEKFEGYYLNLGDGYSNNPATDFDDAVQIKSIGSSYFANNTAASNTSYITVPSTRVGFALSATYTANVDSISRDIENVPTFNIAASGYSDSIIMSLFKVRPSPFSPTVTTLQYVLQEGYTGSLYANRKIQDPLGGQPLSFFLKTVANDNSNNLEVLVNPNISEYTNWLDNNGNSTKRVRIYKTNTDVEIAASTASDPDYTFYTAASAYLGVKNNSFKAANKLYALGTYSDSLPLNNAKVIGNVGSKLDYVLNLAENTDTVAIDITLDAGLSTIAAATTVLSAAEYDDTAMSTALTTQLQELYNQTGNPVSNDLTASWTAITNQFETFARSRRRDHIFISDPLRHILVTGQNFKTLDDKTKNFSQNVYWPLRNLYSAFNSSYATAYANWARVQDIFTSQNVWLPFSGFAAAMMTSSDANNFPWTAAAGLNRGIINGLNDIGINPQQKQRDLLYKVSLNPVVFFPNEGYSVFGQKTLLKAPSAFDRINVRRLFLYLEKTALQTMKYFVFEPNTTFTRSRVINTLSPVFELARNTQGLFDYLIVCNDTNNTGDVIDDNTLVVDIYIKPVRTAEFILVNFYATKTSQNFNELLQG
jgi:phage tail sheath protein FI